MNRTGVTLLISAVIALLLIIGAALFFYSPYDSSPINNPALNGVVQPNANANVNEPVAPITSEEHYAAVSRLMSPPLPLVPVPTDSGAGGKAKELPADYSVLLSIPIPGSNDSVRTYVPRQCAGTHAAQVADCLLDAKKPALIFRFRPDGATLEYVAGISGSSGANYGGIFMPQGITPDAKNVILRAWMGSPGAGGGNVNFGYSSIALSSYGNGRVITSAALPRIASPLAIFYADYGKAVSLEESKDVADYVQPGRNPNQGAIVYRDLAAGTKRTLAEAPNYTYEILDFNENAKELSVQEIKWSFGPECSGNSMSLDCGTPQAYDRTIALP